MKKFFIISYTILEDHLQGELHGSKVKTLAKPCAHLEVENPIIIVQLLTLFLLCKLYKSISDLSVPSLSKLCMQTIRFSSTQQSHGTLCEEFEKVLPTQLAQNISVEYTHLRPNKLQILVPKPDFNCLCVHRYFCCQKNREQPRCCIEDACAPSRHETDISKDLRGMQL